MTFSPDLWAPPVEGVTLQLKGRPSPRRLAAQTRAAVMLQMRYERWLQWHLSRSLAGIRRELEELGHIPDQLEAYAIIAGHQAEQERILQDLYLRVIPSAAAMAMPPSSLKAYRRAIEAKALTPEQERILQQIREGLHSSTTAMSMSTLAAVMRAADTARGVTTTRDDLVMWLDLMPSEGVAYDRHRDELDRFIDALQSSGAFTPARARMIAVTETNEAVNRALAQVSDEAVSPDDVRVKEWSTWQDSLVRDTHRTMHGTVIPEEELFRVPRTKVGHDLMEWPGDTMHGASPENFINCRCKCFHYVED